MSKPKWPIEDITFAYQGHRSAVDAGLRVVGYVSETWELTTDGAVFLGRHECAQTWPWDDSADVTVLRPIPAIEPFEA